MYDYQFRTFVTVADCGSFTRAAEKLFITPTVVMKQINSLESHLDLVLINRTSHGISLTPAGVEIYKDTKFLFDYSKKSIENAKRAMVTKEKIFRIGTSMLNPARRFMDIWYLVNKEFPEYRLNLVPFKDTHAGILSEISQLGVKFDFLMAVCDSKTWLNTCNMLTIGFYRQMCCLPRNHRLADKNIINIEDLYGETVMMVAKEDSITNDAIREEITQKHPQIQIEDTQQFYDSSVFNRCAESGNILFILECWQNIHPELISIPINWNYKSPYGILYSLNPTDEVNKFITAVRDANIDVK